MAEDKKETALDKKAKELRGDDPKRDWRDEKDTEGKTYWQKLAEGEKKGK